MYQDKDFYLNFDFLYRKLTNKKVDEPLTEDVEKTLLKISWPIMVSAYLDNYETRITKTHSSDKYLAITFLTTNKITNMEVDDDPKKVIDPKIKVNVKIEITVPRRVLNQPNSFINDLIGYGFYINLSEKKWFIEYLSRQIPEVSMLYVTKPGWTSDLKAFVLQDKVISKDDNLKENLKLINPTNKFGKLNEYQDWQEHVVKPAIKYPLFAFALATAFTPILLRFVKMDSFCVNLYGESSKGKTTALQVASTVWGSGSDPSQPDSYIHNWNATGNALNYLAAGSNDVLLAIDELGSFSNGSLGQVAYDMSGGTSRKGMKANNQLRDDLTWNTVLLSSSEVSGRQKMEEEGRVYTGQLNRFIDIPVNDLEITDADVQEKITAELSDALKDSCSKYYGTAGLELITTITDYSAGIDDLTNKIKERHKCNLDYLLVLDEVKSINLTAELKRSINRFALIFTAGQLIASGNIVALFEPELDPEIDYTTIDEASPEYKATLSLAIQAHSALRITLKKVFVAWLKGLNQEPRSSSERILATIEEFIFANQSKFIVIEKKVKDLPFSGFGYYHKTKKLFLLTDATFTKACHGFSATESAKALRDVGLLHTQDFKRLKSYFNVGTVAGVKERRFYAIKEEILKEPENA